MLRFTSPARVALARAELLAIERKSGVVGTAHLLLALLETDDSRVAALLLLCGVKRDEARLYAESALETKAESDFRAPLPSRALQRVKAWAPSEARGETVGPEHLLIALSRLRREEQLGAVMRSLGLSPGVLRAHLRAIETDENAAGRPLRMLDTEAKAALEAAHAQMRASYCGRVSTTHLLIGLIDAPFRGRRWAEKQGVDWAELRALAVEAQSGDGIVGGPQIQLSPAAKRALERAKAVAMEHQQTQIAPEHLLWALLPRAASWREKWRYGSELDDPLMRVWARYDGAPLQSALKALLDLESQTPSASHKERGARQWQRAEYVRLDWRWTLGGLAWWSWLRLSVEVGLLLIGAAIVLAIVLSIAGALGRSRPLRDGAASWLCGAILGFFILP